MWKFDRIGIEGQSVNYWNRLGGIHANPDIPSPAQPIHTASFCLYGKIYPTPVLHQFVLTSQD